MATERVPYLVIGDDYKFIDGRSISLTFNEIDGFTIGNCDAKLGFAHSDTNDDASMTTTDYQLSDNNDGTWTVHFDIDKTQTENVLTQGNYHWSIEISESGEEITVAKSVNKSDRISWLNKQT